MKTFFTIIMWLCNFALALSIATFVISIDNYLVKDTIFKHPYLRYVHDFGMGVLIYQVYSVLFFKKNIK